MLPAGYEASSNKIKIILLLSCIITRQRPNPPFPFPPPRHLVWPPFFHPYAFCFQLAVSLLSLYCFTGALLLEPFFFPRLFSTLFVFRHCHKLEMKTGRK